MSEQAEEHLANGIVEARMAEIMRRFGDRLSEEQQALVRARIGVAVALGEAVRRVPFSNADEPEIVFNPYREEEAR